MRKKMNLKLKEGALHRALGVPEGEKIPRTLLTIKPGDSPLMKKRKRFAKTAAKWKK